jgi:hypothetical protein
VLRKKNAMLIDLLSAVAKKKKRRKKGGRKRRSDKGRKRRKRRRGRTGKLEEGLNYRRFPEGHLQ